MISNERYLCFNLGKEEFAIPLLAVKEVIGMPDTTPIPQSPTYFLGIMNLRGSVISIMDLRIKLGIKANNTDETTVIILDLDSHSLGVVVDEVNSVIAFDKNLVGAKPVVESSKANEYISGVYRKQEELVLLLDVAKALSIEDRSLIKNKIA